MNCSVKRFDHTNHNKFVITSEMIYRSWHREGFNGRFQLVSSNEWNIVTNYYHADSDQVNRYLFTYNDFIKYFNTPINGYPGISKEDVVKLKFGDSKGERMYEHTITISDIGKRVHRNSNGNIVLLTDKRIDQGREYQACMQQLNWDIISGKRRRIAKIKHDITTGCLIFGADHIIETLQEEIRNLELEL